MWTVIGVTAAVSIFFNLLQKSVKEYSFISFVVTILAIAIGFTVQLGLIRIYLDLIDQEKEDELKTLFTNYRLIWRYLGASILFGIAVALGLIFLIVPGIYFNLKYQYYAYLIVDKNMGVVEALKKSGEITKDIKWKLFCFSLAVVGLNILGALALVIGLLVTGPVSILAYVYVYRTLSKRLEVSQSQT